MVFRKESRADSFQKQISALRQQLSADQEAEDDYYDDAEPMPDAPEYRTASTPTSPPPLERPAAPSVRQADAATGVIAAGSVWDGTLRSDGSVQVFGQAQGTLDVRDEIYVAEGAVVDARISAQTIVVAGRVSGTIECAGRLEVLPTGHVSGDVTSPTLVVHEGATVEGDLRMRAPETRDNAD